MTNWVSSHDEFLSEQEPDDKDAFARELIAQGFKQTSHRYRTVARLPEGMTGLEALRAHDPEFAARLLENAERMAASQYLRIFAEKDGHSRELSRDAFDAFRRAGGKASW